MGHPRGHRTSLLSIGGFTIESRDNFALALIRQLEAEPGVQIVHRASDGGPPIGCMDGPSLVALTSVLANLSTSDQECEFMVWSGHPGLPLRWRPDPRGPMSGQHHYVLRIPLAMVPDVAQALGLLWLFEPVGGRSLPPGTDLSVLRGSHISAESLAPRSPTHLIPRTRTWWLHTGVDDDFSVLRGPSAVVDAVRAHADLLTRGF